MTLKEKILNEVQNNKIRQGILLKQSKYLKEWRERWVILTFNFLISFKNKDCAEVTQIIQLSSIEYLKSFINFKDEMIPAAFKIKSHNSLIYLSAKDAEEKWSWIVSLQRLLDYRIKGASNYNNLTYIKTMGFKSLIDYQQHHDNKSMSMKSEQFQFSTSHSKDQETLILMKELFRKQSQIKKQKDLLRKQKKVLKKQIQQFEEMRTKNPQVINLITSTQSKPELWRKTSFVQENLQEIKEIIQDEERRTTFIRSPGKERISKLTKRKPDQEFANESVRESIIRGIFDQFLPESQIYFGLRYFIDFIAQISTDQRLGFSEIILNCVNHHRNKQNFIHIFVEILQEYSDYKEFEYIAKLLYKLVELNAQKIVKMFTEQQKSSINKKVLDIIISVQSDDKQELIDLLKLIELLFQKLDFQKNEQLIARISRMNRLSKREQIRSLATKFLLS